MGTDILTLPTPQAIQQHVKTLLTTVQPSGSAYHDHKVGRKETLMDLLM